MLLVLSRRSFSVTRGFFLAASSGNAQNNSKLLFIATSSIGHQVPQHCHHRSPFGARAGGTAMTYGSGRGGGGAGRGEYYRNKYGGGGRGRGQGSGGRGGEYYKNKYGGGGRAGGGGRSSGGTTPSSSSSSSAPGGGSYQELRSLLSSIDGRQYPAYRDIETSERGWSHPAGFLLQVGRAQSDPFAPPTRCRVTVPPAAAQLPAALLGSKIRRVAAADYLWRRLHAECRRMGADSSLRTAGGGGWSGPKGGDLRVMEPTQHVVEQSAVAVDELGSVTVQLTINLPARGRSILGRAAQQILDETLSHLVQSSLLAQSLNEAELTQHVESIEDQAWLQNQLKSAGLVSFVRNGAMLPRVSGVDDRPMQGGVPFQSPPSLQVGFRLPNAGVEVTGMGIPTGVTLICGGGFHGKSTLLQTLQLGVYYKIPGDGREFCVTAPAAAKIRAEDGRNIQSVDISSFIRNLPFDKDTSNFSTADASGSTSQASNIVEAVELGADSLLIDEDTCATNFMIRDTKMIQLVACEKEPITPFVRVVTSLKERGVSTVMVIGGTGDFFDVADHVLVMDCYRCRDATARAREIVAQHRAAGEPTTILAPFAPIRERHLLSNVLQPNGKVKVQTRNVISYGETDLDLSALEQIVSNSQANGISSALQTLAAAGGDAPLRSALESLDRLIDSNGLDALAPGQFNGGLMRPRLLETGGAINRLRRDFIKQR